MVVSVERLIRPALARADCDSRSPVLASYMCMVLIFSGEMTAVETVES